MKKIVTMILACFLLVGCKKQDVNVQNELDQKVERAQSMDAGHATFNHGYYSYYIQPGIGRIYSDRTSNVFMMDGIQFVMNLNVAGIVNRTYESQDTIVEELINKECLVAQSSGDMEDFNGISHPYTIEIYQKGEVFYTLLRTDLLEFYSLSNELSSTLLAEEMLKIARSTIVHEDEVLADYSKQETISYNRKTLELFQNIAPESGVVDELFDTKSNYAGSSSGQFTTDANASEDEEDVSRNTEEQSDEEVTDTEDDQYNEEEQVVRDGKEIDVQVETEDEAIKQEALDDQD